MEGDRDIGDHRAMDNLIPSKKVSSAMGMQVEDVDLCK
jgi:hypothetical protein